MKLLDNIKNKTLIICSNKAKKLILNEINNYNKLFNIKFLTKEEFYKYTYFDYDKNTVYYLMNKLNIKYDIATSYLNNLIYLNDTKCDNIKINFLSSIKSDIDNLLIYNILIFSIRMIISESVVKKWCTPLIVVPSSFV